MQRWPETTELLLIIPFIARKETIKKLEPGARLHAWRPSIRTGIGEYELGGRRHHSIEANQEDWSRCFTD